MAWRDFLEPDLGRSMEEDDSWPRLCVHCGVVEVEKPPLPSPHPLCAECREALSSFKDDAFKRGATKGAA